MKVLLVRPPMEFRRGWDVAGQAPVPLALLYLGAVLERDGHEVTVFDGAIQETPSNLEFDAEGVLHIGAPWAAVADAAHRTRPDVVGISSMFYTQMPQALRVARLVREALPDVPIIVGGAPVTVRPEDYLAEPAVTAAVIGEGEPVVSRLAEVLAAGRSVEGLPNVAWRDGDAVRTHEERAFVDLDALPDPAYHLVDVAPYLRAPWRDRRGEWHWKPTPIMTVLTSRGCPFKCTYCAVHLHMGRTYRYQSAERVLAHLRSIVTDLGLRHVHFIDDNLGQHRGRFRAILDGLIAMQEEGLGIEWDTPIGMRTDRLDEGLLARARKAGCRSIYLTVESGSQRVLDEVIHKNLDLAKVVEAAGACKRLGIKARAGFIMGLPGERLEDMQQTIDFARRLRREFGIRGHLCIGTPLYGTRLHETCVREGYLKKEVMPNHVARSFFEPGMIETEDWSIDDLRRMQAAFRDQDGWLHRTVRRLRHGLSDLVHPVAPR